MSIATIQAALDKYLNDNQGSDIAIAWEGTAYIPTQSVPFLAPQTAGLINSPTGPGKDSIVQIDGTYQISVWFPIGQGMQPVRQKSDEIVALFRRGTLLTTSDNKAVITEVPYQVMAIQEGNWIHVPVMVPWFVYDSY